MAALYRRAPIIPSLCHETVGLVVLESLRRETPVYVTPHGALPELVERTRGGRIFQFVDELCTTLGGAIPVKADLSAFEPQTHLRNYLDIIAAARPGQKRYAHV